MELADREGLDAVSMRRLAAALGAGAASLYRYVATRDDLLEHLLDVLADHPAEPTPKLEAFAVLNALTVLFVQNEPAAADPGAQRQSSYLRHVATTGSHPRISALLAATRPEGDRFDAVLTRTLTGVLG